MDRDKSIIYICTEGNAKSCYGLHTLIEDGWNIKLVIAFNKKNSKKITSLKEFLFAFRRAKNYFLRMIELSLLSQHRTCLFPFDTIIKICQNNDIDHLETEDKTLFSCYSKIIDSHPSIILLNGWMFHMASEISSIAKIVTLNCHSSYLPEYRGGNVTYAPLINQEVQSGVTVHEVVEKFDAGRIIAQHRVSVELGESSLSLNAKRALITGGVLIEALERVGQEEHYLENPISPFYFRCNYETYVKMRFFNSIRRLIGLPMKSYKSKPRYDL